MALDNQPFPTCLLGLAKKCGGYPNIPFSMKAARGRCKKTVQALLCHIKTPRCQWHRGVILSGVNIYHRGDWLSGDTEDTINTIMNNDNQEDDHNDHQGDDNQNYGHRCSTKISRLYVQLKLRLCTCVSTKTRASGVRLKLGLQAFD